MKATRLILFLSGIFVLNSLQAGILAITDGTVIDGRGGKPINNAVVLVKNKKIIAVGKQGEIEIPKDSRRIEAKGKYLTPGLMDANVHLYYENNIENLARYEGRYEEIIAEAAQIALKSGITTVFDSWGPRQSLVNVRNAINAGDIPGSRIYLAGNIVGLGGPFSDDFSSKARQVATSSFVSRVNAMWEQGVGRDLMWMSTEQIRQKVRTYLTRDIDFLKYAASGHGVGKGRYIAFSPEAQQAMMEEARRANVTVQTHTSTVGSLRMTIEANVDLLQHCDVTGPVATPSSIIQLMVDQGIPCSTLPTTEKSRAHILSMNKTFLSGLRDKGLDFEVMDINVRNMIKAGVTLLLSTDGGIFGPDKVNDPVWGDFFNGGEMISILGQGHVVWMKAMVQKGMKPMEALLAATSNIAKAYKVDDTLGTLEKGKTADILVLGSNPLADVENFRDIYKIFKEGKEVDRSALPVKPILTAKKSMVNTQ